jgi:hypothetical protein
MEAGAWESFYVIVGAAAGALIGLQFVVMTLIAERPSAGVAETGRAFATPTVVHFSACLLVSALVQAPWPEPHHAAWAAGAVGVCGIVYMALPVQRMRSQHAYRMDMEDGIFHVLLPFMAYGFLILSWLAAGTHLPLALFGVAGAALLLLFTGIHNAWDAVAYQVYVVRREPPGEP